MEKIEVLDFNEQPKKRKLKVFRLLLLLLGLLLIVLLGIGVWFVIQLKPVSKKSESVNFTIKEGLSVYAVGNELHKNQLIKSVLAYKILVKIKGINEYKAGIYKLNKNYSTSKIIDTLTKKYKNSGDIRVTFKEGKNFRNFVKIVTENTNITEDEIYAKLKDESYIDSLINKYWFLSTDIKNKDIYYPLEGYLYPETYEFSKNVNIETIIDTLLHQTDVILSKYKDKIDSSKYSIHEIITLASIIENEGVYKNDRKKIAGVFFNRLNTNMSLGSDVTTYYAFKIDFSERDLTKKEINTYNPYNTRGPKMEGKLPVGPISNFSISSLEAVLDPLIEDYYYFVADNEGNTYFTRTYEEHMKKVNELKKAGKWITW